MAKLDQVLQQVREEVGSDFIMSLIVGMDGISIGVNSIIPGENAEAEGSARMSMIAKLGEKVGAKMGIGKMNDQMITASTAYIIIRMLGNGSYLWMLTVRRSATLGTVRMMMNEFAPRIWDAIPS